MPKLFLSVIMLFLIVTKVECKCGPNELLNHNGICLSPVGLPDCNPSECGEFMKCNQLNECVCLEGFEEYMDYKDYRIKCWKSIPKVSPSSTEKIYTLESVWQQVLPKNQAHKGEDVNTSTAKNSEKQTTLALTKSQDESLNASTSSSPEGHSTTEVSLTNATTENKEASTLGTDSTKPSQTNTTAEDTEPSAFGSQNSIPKKSSNVTTPVSNDVETSTNTSVAAQNATHSPLSNNMSENILYSNYSIKQSHKTLQTTSTDTSTTINVECNNPTPTSTEDSLAEPLSSNITTEINKIKELPEEVINESEPTVKSLLRHNQTEFEVSANRISKQALEEIQQTITTEHKKSLVQGVESPIAEVDKSSEESKIKSTTFEDLLESSTVLISTNILPERDNSQTTLNNQQSSFTNSYTTSKGLETTTSQSPANLSTPINGPVTDYSEQLNNTLDHMSNQLMASTITSDLESHTTLNNKQLSSTNSYTTSKGLETITSQSPTNLSTPINGSLTDYSEQLNNTSDHMSNQLMASTDTLESSATISISSTVAPFEISSISTVSSSDPTQSFNAIDMNETFLNEENQSKQQQISNNLSPIITTTEVYESTTLSSNHGDNMESSPIYSLIKANTSSTDSIMEVAKSSTDSVMGDKKPSTDSTTEVNSALGYKTKQSTEEINELDLEIITYKPFPINKITAFNGSSNAYIDYANNNILHELEMKEILKNPSEMTTDHLESTSVTTEDGEPFTLTPKTKPAKFILNNPTNYSGFGESFNDTSTNNFNRDVIGSDLTPIVVTLNPDEEQLSQENDSISSTNLYTTNIYADIKETSTLGTKQPSMPNVQSTISTEHLNISTDEQLTFSTKSVSNIMPNINEFSTQSTDQSKSTTTSENPDESTESSTESHAFVSVMTGNTYHIGSSTSEQELTDSTIDLNTKVITSESPSDISTKSNDSADIDINNIYKSGTYTNTFESTEPTDNQFPRNQTSDGLSSISTIIEIFESSVNNEQSTSSITSELNGTTTLNDSSEQMESSSEEMNITNTTLISRHLLKLNNTKLKTFEEPKQLSESTELSATTENEKYADQSTENYLNYNNTNPSSTFTTSDYSWQSRTTTTVPYVIYKSMLSSGKSPSSIPSEFNGTITLNDSSEQTESSTEEIKTSSTLISQKFTSDNSWQLTELYTAPYVIGSNTRFNVSTNTTTSTSSTNNPSSNDADTASTAEYTDEPSTNHGTVYNGSSSYDIEHSTERNFLSSTNSLANIFPTHNNTSIYTESSIDFSLLNNNKQLRESLNDMKSSTTIHLMNTSESSTNTSPIESNTSYANGSRNHNTEETSKMKYNTATSTTVSYNLSSTIDLSLPNVTTTMLPKNIYPNKVDTSLERNNSVDQCLKGENICSTLCCRGKSICDQVKGCRCLQGFKAALLGNTTAVYCVPNEDVKKLPYRYPPFYIITGFVCIGFALGYLYTMLLCYTQKF